MQKVIEYRSSCNPAVVVTVPVDFAVDGESLTQEQRALFIEAAKRAGVPIDRMVARIQQLRGEHPEVVEEARQDVRQREGMPLAASAPSWAYDPQPDAFKETIPNAPPAIFVSIGCDVVDEFWPVYWPA